MTPNEAFSLLEDVELVPLVEGRVDEIKKLHARCLENDIPAMVGSPDRCGSGSCSPKVQLLVREDDAGGVASLLREDWAQMVAREGTVQAMQPLAVTEEGELPCPACGTAAPLLDGACSDCGLQLE